MLILFVLWIISVIAAVWHRRERNSKTPPTNALKISTSSGGGFEPTTRTVNPLETVLRRSRSSVARMQRASIYWLRRIHL